jgi:hypothetical protein
LIGRVVEILPRRVSENAFIRSGGAVQAVEQLTRISTGAALRVLG